MPRGEVAVRLCSSFDLEPRWGGWLTPRPVRFNPKKGTSTHFTGGWVDSRLWKTSPTLGIVLWTIRAVASRYNDCCTLEEFLIVGTLRLNFSYNPHNTFCLTAVFAQIH